MSIPTALFSQNLFSVLTKRSICAIIYERRHCRTAYLSFVKSYARSIGLCTETSYAGIFRLCRRYSPRASMRNTNFKKYAGLFRLLPNVANWIRLRRATSNVHVFNKISYAGLFRRPPNVANRIRLRRATSNAHVFNKISYAGLSKWSQRGGLENRLPNRHGGSNPSACAKKHQLFGWCFSIFCIKFVCGHNG